MMTPWLNRGLAALSILAAGGLAAAQAAPAEKALPDWSGVWNPHERNLFDASALAAGEVKAKDTGSSLFEASYMRMYPPYRPDYEARYVAVLKKTEAGISTDPTAACVPPGVPNSGWPRTLVELASPTIASTIDFSSTPIDWREASVCVPLPACVASSVARVSCVLICEITLLA